MKAGVQMSVNAKVINISEYLSKKETTQEIKMQHLQKLISDHKDLLGLVSWAFLIYILYRNIFLENRVVIQLRK
ncbi:MAG: hypothetical protein A4E55_02372 [Pelotomaculum sp. PtaU1.Bin035]|nr:MAG: hypothetical protein A4E55_02372 [Pelotomaculum sp. PtaU1.Bin035]